MSTFLKITVQTLLLLARLSSAVAGAASKIEKTFYLEVSYKKMRILQINCRKKVTMEVLNNDTLCSSVNNPMFLSNQLLPVTFSVLGYAKRWHSTEQ